MKKIITILLLCMANKLYAQQSLWGVYEQNSIIRTRLTLLPDASFIEKTLGASCGFLAAHMDRTDRNGYWEVNNEILTLRYNPTKHRNSVYIRTYYTDTTFVGKLLGKKKMTVFGTSCKPKGLIATAK